jgi:hypothetical protein
MRRAIRVPWSRPSASSCSRGVEVVAGCLDARVSLDRGENIEQVSAQVLQLELAAFTGANVLERLFGEA